MGLFDVVDFEISFLFCFLLPTSFSVYLDLGSLWGISSTNFHVSLYLFSFRE